MKLTLNQPLQIGNNQSDVPQNEWQRTPMPHRRQPQLLRIYDESATARKLIGTTCLFRNRPLLRTVLEQLNSDATEITVLVHASSIGSDVFSFCIAWDLFFQGRRRPVLKCFATDLCPSFLARAARATYPSSVLQDMAPEEQEYFETVDEDNCRVVARIREQVTFLPAASYVEFSCDHQFDVVFLLNSLLYVSASDQSRAVDCIAGYNRGFLVTTGFHADRIQQDLIRNSYEPVPENLELIYESWTCRRSLEADMILDGVTYHTPALGPLCPCDDYSYRFGTLFAKRGYHASGAPNSNLAVALVGESPDAGGCRLAIAGGAGVGKRRLKPLRIALFNDTGKMVHVGCRGVSSGHEQIFSRLGVEVCYRSCCGEWTDLWAGTLSGSSKKFQQSLLPSLLKDVDAVVVNGEGTIHHGRGLHLLVILAGAQSLELPTFLVNAVFQDCEHDLETLRRLNDLTVRDARSSAYLQSLGIAHRVVFDSIFEAAFDPLPAHDFTGKIVVTDWHEARDADVGQMMRKLIEHLGAAAVFYPLHSSERELDWRSAVADLRQARLVVTGRHHGVCLAAMAGVPFVALGSNTWKVEGLLSLLPGNLQVCDDSRRLLEMCEQAMNDRPCFEQIQRFVQAQLPLATCDKLVRLKSKSRPEVEQSSSAISEIAAFVAQLGQFFAAKTILQVDWSSNREAELCQFHSGQKSGQRHRVETDETKPALPCEDDTNDTVFNLATIATLSDTALPGWLGEIHRVVRRDLWVVVETSPGRDRNWWEQQFFKVGFRKHPLLLRLQPYESLANTTGALTLVLEKIPLAALQRYPLAVLKAERDLHMDMLRESGPRSDAHLARYQLAADDAADCKVIVDLACGLGYGSAMLARQFPAARVIGVDISPFAIAYAQENFARTLPNLEFHQADAGDFRWLAGRRIDLLVSFETIEHIPNPDLFLDQAAAQMAPGGKFIGSVPNMWVDENGNDPNPFHLHVFNHDRFRELVSQQFEVDSVWRQNAEQGIKAGQPRRLQRIKGDRPDPEESEHAEWWLLVGHKRASTATPARAEARAQTIPFAAAELDLRLDEFLTVCGEQRVLVAGPGATGIVSKLLGRGVDAWGVDTLGGAPAAGRGDRCLAGSLAELPVQRGPFHSAMLLGALDELELPELRETLEVLRQTVTQAVHARIFRKRSPRRNRLWWEQLFLTAGFRKHPVRSHVLPFEGLEHEEPLVLYFERITPAGEQHDATAGQVFDPTRRIGRSADAILARYELAVPLVRPWDTVLDLGCGAGHGTYLLRRATRGRRFIGVDANETDLAYARAHFNSATTEFRWAEPGDVLLDLPEASIDFALCSLPLDEAGAVDGLLCGMHRVLAPGGRLVFTLNAQSGSLDGEALQQRLKNGFLVEQSYRQTGCDESITPRSLQRAPLPKLTTASAGVWLLVVMKDPLGAPLPAHRETAFSNVAAGDHAAVLRYPEFYSNPWILHSLVHGGFRLTSPELLGQAALRLLLSSPEESADAGAALCVLLYRAVEGTLPAGLELSSLRCRAERYLKLTSCNAHQLRWQVSLEFVLAQLALHAGDFTEARRRFSAVAERDVFQWGPSLATKTTEALFLAGWLAWCAADLADARRCWTRGVEFGRQLLLHPLDETLLNPACPNLFDYGDGMKELTGALENVTRCANGLHALQLREQGISCRWEHIFNSYRSQLDNTRHALGEAYARLSHTPNPPSAPATASVPAALREELRLHYGDGVHKDEGDFRWLDSVAMLKVIAPAGTRGTVVSFTLRIGKMEWYRSALVRTTIRANDKVVHEIQFSKDFQTESVKIAMAPDVESKSIRIESDAFFGGGSDDPRKLTVQLRECAVSAAASGASPEKPAAANSMTPTSLPLPVARASASLEEEAEHEYRKVETSRHFDLERARRALDIFAQWPETVEYHRNHLNRYLATMERLRHLPRHTRALEVGAPPFGMTVLMKEFLFDHLEVSGFAENNKQRAQTVYSERVRQGNPEAGAGYAFDMQCFNLETHTWPYPDKSFDLTISCEVFEHLSLDPMHAFSEANRILKEGGHFFVTVPNAISVANLERMLAGRQPNSFPFWRPRGECLRHNREYTAAELQALFRAAGFEVEWIETCNFGPPPPIPTELLVHLRGLVGDFQLRRDVVIGLARKIGPVVCRYPTEADLYYEWDVKANRV